MITAKLTLTPDGVNAYEAAIDFLGVGCKYLLRGESCVAITAQGGPLQYSEGCPPSDGAFLELPEGECIELQVCNLDNLFLAGSGCAILSSCDLKPSGGTGGTTTEPGEVPPGKVTVSKPFDYVLNGESRCRCGDVVSVFECSETGVLTELTRTFRGDDCEILEAGSFGTVEKEGDIDTGFECETICANFELSVDVDTEITLEDLVQILDDRGFGEFPSGMPLTVDNCLFYLEVMLLKCGNEVGDLSTDEATTDDEAVIAQPGGYFINLDGGGRRVFDAGKEGKIQGVDSIKLSAGSALSICAKYSNWIETICLSPAS